MYKIKGKKYLTDYAQEEFEKTFNSLEEIFNFMSNESNNFEEDRKSNLNLPKRNTNSEYGWVRRISVTLPRSNRYTYLWIEEISTENGIVYSSGKYTNGEKFCSKKVENWLKECEDKFNSYKPKFIED